MPFGVQLVWLHAVEFEGPRNITAEVLGEYWLSFITGYWNEYGIARRNMEKGVIRTLGKNNIDGVSQKVNEKVMYRCRFAACQSR